MGHFVSEFVLVQSIGTLDDDWWKLLVPGADIFLLGFGLSDVRDPTHSLDVAMALLLLDKMCLREVFMVEVVSHGKLRVNLTGFGSRGYGRGLFCYFSLSGLSLGFLHQSWLVEGVFGILVVEVDELDNWGEIISDRDVHGVRD